jgi:predicted enzyme related to lactoylglutathione lyase
MPFHAEFAHTNLIADDWRALSAFYERVFECKPVGPVRSLSDDWVAAITAVPNAELHVVHLRLPGLGDEGPTLEIIQYNDPKERQPTAANRPGFAHIAFTVDDVEAARDAVISAGGQPVGEIVSVDVPDQGTLTMTYVADPEGNIIELQSWRR